MTYSIIYMTFDRKKIARDVARILVEEKLVSCANIFKEVESIYNWNGNVENEIEIVVTAKTTSSNVANVIDRVKALHNYECPCVISYKIEHGEKNYLKWIENSVNPGINKTYS